MSKQFKSKPQDKIKEDSNESSGVLNQETKPLDARPEISPVEKTEEVKEQAPEQISQPEIKKQRLALFYKRFTLSRPYANLAKSFNKTYDAKSYVTEDDLIDELVSLNAPIGIFERVD